MIHGKAWQTIRLSGRWFDAELSGEARRLREQLGTHRLVIGTLGREEKMADRRFVELVARLLRDHPDVLYVWSGRSRPSAVVDVFERHGVLDRQRFLGWVNTRMVSQAIDVYLDTFPAPSGFTAREAMASGAATVFFHSAESDETGPNGFMRRLLSGEGHPEEVARARAIMQPQAEALFLLAETPQEYEAHARRLLADEALRARVGAANRAWIRAFYEDDAGMLESHARAVLAA
jgi:glycosyltransferase involved in cell wall biosynthesis